MNGCGGCFPSVVSLHRHSDGILQQDWNLSPVLFSGPGEAFEGVSGALWCFACGNLVKHAPTFTSALSDGRLVGLCGVMRGR